jgi:Ca2+-binding RTX toxin-like protein
MAIFDGTGGADSLVGADDVADTFRFAPGTLAAGDTVSGGGGAGVVDTLLLTGQDTILPEQLAGVRGIERITMNAAGGLVMATAALVASADGGVLEMRGGAGNDTLYASDLGLSPTLALRMFTGAGTADSLYGGAGADTLMAQGAGQLGAQLGNGDDLVVTAAAFLDAGDWLDGGTGADRLQFNTAGTIALAALANVSGFETFQLSAGGSNTLTIDQGVVTRAGGLLTVQGGNEGSLVDAAAVTTGRILYRAAGGADSMLGGGGADTVEAAGSLSGNLGAGRDLLRLATAAAAGASTVEGGAGFDTILLLAAGEHDISRLTGFERLVAERNISLATGTGALRLEVDASDFNDAITVGGALQTVFGNDGDDVVTIALNLLDGAVLDGGWQAGRDTLVLTGSGFGALAGSALVTGFERILVTGGDTPEALTGIRLGFQDAEVRLRAAAEVELGRVATQKVFGSAYDDTLTGAAAGQVLHGNAGDDRISTTLDDLLAGTLASGGSGSDTLIMLGSGTVDLDSDITAIGFEAYVFGGPTDAETFKHNATLIGGGYGDTLASWGMNGLVSGEGGDDWLRGSFAGAGGTTLSGGSGNDTLSSSRSAESLSGGSGNDYLIIGSGRDTVDGGAGSDTISMGIASNYVAVGWTAPGMVLRGGAGSEFDEIQVFNGNSVLDLLDDTVEGIDRIVLDTDLAMTLVLNAGMAGTADGNGDSIMGDLAVRTGNNRQGAMLVDASAFAIGSGHALRFQGGSGADTVTGGGGNDTIHAGDGGNRLFGNAGADSLYGAFGYNLMDGGTGDDTLGNLNGDVTLIGGDGQDLVNAGFGADTLRGDAGADTILAGGGADTADGGNDADLLDGQDAADLLLGWLGLDTLIGGTGNDTLDGGSEGDSLAGQAGADSLFGNIGNDTLDGGEDADTLLGGNDQDSLPGGAGADSLDGGAGNDTLDGGLDQDTLAGGFGNDSLTGGSGNDSLDGGVGNDTIADSADNNHVIAGDGNDSVALGVGADTVFGEDGNDIVTAGAGNNRLFGGFGNDRLGASFGDDSMLGEAGADSLDGGQGIDTLVGGADADTLAGGTGGDRIDLTETTAAADRVRILATTDGSTDINDATSVTEAQADRIFGFGTGDALMLSAAGLGLTTVGVQVVGLNAAWNMGSAAVFIFNAADTLQSNNFASLAELTDPVAGFMADTGGASGSAAGRTVAMLVENDPSQATNRVGVYLWTDVDGDAVLEAGDVVRLMAVLENFSTANLSSANVLLV